MAGWRRPPAHKALARSRSPRRMRRPGPEPGEVSEVIIGRSSPPAKGRTRRARRRSRAGIPVRGDGLRGQSALRLGPAHGGAWATRRSSPRQRDRRRRRQESMSPGPALHASAQTASRWATPRMIDTMIRDGLWDAFNGYHMRQYRERAALARSPASSRTKFATGSQQIRPDRRRISRSLQDEIVPVTISEGRAATTVRDTDGASKHGTTFEVLSACAGVRQERPRDRGTRHARHQ